MNETLIFFKIVPLLFYILILVSFLLVEAFLKHFFDIVLICTIIFLLMSPASSNLTIAINLQFWKQEKMMHSAKF